MHAIPQNFSFIVYFILSEFQNVAVPNIKN